MYCDFWHRLLLLKLDKQIGGTIYWPTLAANEACHMEGVGCPVGGGGLLHGWVRCWRGWGATLEGVGVTLEGVGYSKHTLTCLVGSDFHH